MAKVSIHVWHDTKGRIIAIGRPAAARDSGRKVTPVAGKRQFVLEAEAEEAHVGSLAKTHVVDVRKKTLVEAANRRK